MDLQLVPQRRAHAGEQFVHPERFGEIIIGAEIGRLDLSGLVAAARQPHGGQAGNSIAVLPLEASRPSYPWVLNPTRSNLRIGGSSSMTRTLIGAAFMRRCPALLMPPGSAA